MKRKIICTVTNDLTQDQRMIRICDTLSAIDELEVILVGRKRPKSLDLSETHYSKIRMNCYFERGPLFYLEYNVRVMSLLIHLVNKQDIIYTVDTDTLLAGGLVRWWKGCKQVFDAHEYFTKVPELIHKPYTRFVWSLIESVFIPKADAHITVSNSLAGIFSTKYKVSFLTLYNVPKKNQDFIDKVDVKSPPVIVYVGMVNQGRGLEEMIYAMEKIPAALLWVIGTGDEMERLIRLAKTSAAASRIVFHGWKSADEIKTLLLSATIGINLLNGSSESYYYSLANKFFDFMHAGLPSVNMDFPEYQNIINRFDVGVTIPSLNIKDISSAINLMIGDDEKLSQMQSGCAKAKKVYNWEHESQKLTDVVLKLLALPI